MTTYQKSTSELETHIEIADHWRPYFDAVGIETAGWSNWALYRLAPIIWDNPIVQQACLVAPRNPKFPAMCTDSVAVVKALSDETKQKLRQLVFDAIKGQEDRLK